MTLCSLCPVTRGRNPIPYHGPTPCRILFIPEAPAKNEDARGIPLCGQTGLEFDNQYLTLASLFRDNVGVINSVLCSQPSYRNPTPDEALCCSTKHLPALLDQLQPQIIVPMGSVACSLFPNVSLMLQHGIPQLGDLFKWSGIVFPMFHPSAGLHSTAYMIPLRRDFEALGRLVKSLDNDTFSWPEDPHPTPDYKILRSIDDIEDYVIGEDCGPYLFGEPFFTELGTDTESIPDGSPHCLTISSRPGSGRLIYTSDKDLIKTYGQLLRDTNPLLHFHAYLHDRPVYHEMGLPSDRFSDTMVRAYNMGLGGGGDEEDGGGSGAARGLLGLKTLAYRHLNMLMPSFKDTVLPHTIPLVLSWLSRASSLVSPGEDTGPMCVCGHPQENHKAKGKSGRRTEWCEFDDGRLNSDLISELSNQAEPMCGCEKYKKAPAPKKDRDAGYLYRKIKTLTNQLQAGEWARAEKPVDPWKRVMGNEEKDKEGNGWHNWEKEMLVMELGPMPVMDIRLVPEEEMVVYACRDSDATLRFSRFLDRYKVF